MHTKINRLRKRTIPAALALAVAVPSIAFAADVYDINSVYAGGGAGKSQDQQTDSNWKTSGKAFVGYEFNKVFLETGYVDLGKHDTGSSNTVRARGPFIQALAHFTVNQSFRPFLKGGIHRLEMTTRTSSASSAERNTNPAWGAGLNFNIGKHMGLRFEWERFKIERHDTDLVSANIVHYFR